MNIPKWAGATVTRMPITTASTIDETHSETYNLVCEGPCNGSLVRMYDDIVRASLVDFKPVMTEAMLAHGRALRHTPHVQDVGPYWACEVCGQSRRWGF